MNNACDITKNGLIDNFNEGLKLEYRALSYFDELLELLDDEEDKKIIQYIINDEKEHIEITKKLISISNTHFTE